MAKLPLLKGNYVYWKFKMEHALKVRALWKIVIGEEQAPQESTAKALWEKRDEEARQCIVMTVDEDNTSILFRAKTSHEMWTNLEEVFRKRVWQTS